VRAGAEKKADRSRPCDSAPQAAWCDALLAKLNPLARAAEKANEIVGTKAKIERSEH
jgi:hypothetical protein